ncbi:hypothetical protein BH10ACT7_BH10ACT7_12420 [soil metagenome]
MKSPSPPRRECAYPVPFRLERQPSAHLYRIVNESDERLRGLTLTLHGSGMMSANLPESLGAREALEVTVAGHDLARSTILVLRWFRPNGVEYLWRISF